MFGEQSCRGQTNTTLTRGARDDGDTALKEFSGQFHGASFAYEQV